MTHPPCYCFSRVSKEEKSGEGEEEEYDFLGGIGGQGAATAEGPFGASSASFSSSRPLSP